MNDKDGILATWRAFKQGEAIVVKKFQQLLGWDKSRDNEHLPWKYDLVRKVETGVGSFRKSDVVIGTYLG